jgi:type I restriction enzyme S subunit
MVASIDSLFSNVKSKRSQNWLRGKWSEFEPYADENFQTAIAMDFYARFWEMYLTCFLLDKGFALVKRSERNGNSGPDICIKDGERNIWIEAVAPTNGEGGDALEAESSTPQPVWEDQEGIVLRLRSVIDQKYHNYKICVKNKIITQGDPYIIALGCGKLSNIWLEENSSWYPTTLQDPPYLVNAVYAIGRYTYRFDDTGKKIEEGYELREKVEKKNSAEVSTNIFLTDDYNGISAVLSSVIHFNEIDRNPGFVLVQNTHAKNPLPEDWFVKHGDVWWRDNEGKLRGKNKMVTG